MGIMYSLLLMSNKVTQAIKNVAKQLGNRPATCRKYYVHPAVIDAYLEGMLVQIKCNTTASKIPLIHPMSYNQRQ
jgi:DNA topoisomerase-1